MTNQPINMEECMENIVSEERLKEIKKELKEAEPIDLAMIKDNKLPFRVKGSEDFYRVRMPSQLELEIAENEKYNEHTSLLMSKKAVSRTKFKKLLKESQDIDIDAMEKEKEDIERQLHDSYISLAMSKDEDIKRIDLYRAKTQELKDRYIDLFIDIEEYLKPCIENRVQGVYLKILASLCTEVLDKETKEWKPLWKDYEEFKKDSSKVATQAHLTFGHLYNHFNRS